MNNNKRIEMLTDLLVEALEIIDGLHHLVRELEEEKKCLESQVKYKGGAVHA